MEERYTNSLIDSIHKHIYELQYLAKNNKNTLRDLNAFKILHNLYSWADWYSVNEKDKVKLLRLMDCLILRNSDLVLPIIIPSCKFYSNVNTPQTIYTWQKLCGYIPVEPEEPVGSITFSKIVTEEGIVIPNTNRFDIEVTNEEDIIGSFSIMSGTDIVIEDLPLGVYLVAESSPSSGYNLISIVPNPVVITREDLHKNVAITNNKIVIPPSLGSITINKLIRNYLGNPIVDATNFGIILTGPSGKTGTVAQDAPLTFANLIQGTYTISEVLNSSYNLISIIPNTIVINEANLRDSVNIINEEVFVPTFGSITVIKEVYEDGILIEDYTSFEVTLTQPGGNVNGLPQTSVWDDSEVWEDDAIWMDAPNLGGSVSITGTVSSVVNLIFPELAFGTYIITEINLPLGYEWLSTVLSSITLTVENPDQTVVIKNNKVEVITAGNITITKTLTDPIPNPAPTFNINIIGETTISRTLAINTPINVGLNFGDYEIIEVPQIGYALTSITPATFTIGNDNLDVDIQIVNKICGVELDWIFNSYFDHYEQNSISVLSVGNLLSNYVLDAYVIDWYRDGIFEMTSGIGTDPDIESFHPFLGLASIPVLAGLWVPIIRYVVVGGVRIFRDPNHPDRVCEDWNANLGNLPVIIVVAPLDCATTAPGAAPFNFRLSYISSQDFALGARKLRFNLNANAKYMAIRFGGYTVADRIDVYLNGETTLLYSMIVGTNYNTNDWTTTPKKKAIQIVNKIIELPTYVTGNHLIIKITPSVLESNYNTNWQLFLKCLDSSYIFDASAVTNDYSKITDINMVWEPTTCSYNIMLTPLLYSPDTYGLGAFRDVYNIGGGSPTTNNSFGIDYINRKYYLRHLYTKSRGITTISQPGSTQSASSYNTVNYTKINDKLTITYTDIRDYDAAIASLTTIQNNPIFFPEFINDNTHINFYRYIRLDLRLTMLTCGDTATSKTIYVHPTSNITINNVSQQIIITFVPITMGLPQIICDTTYASCENIVFNTNAAITNPDFNINSKCNPIALFGVSTRATGIVQSTATSVNGGCSFTMADNEQIPFSNVGLLRTIIPNGTWGMYFAYFRSVITATRDVNNEYTQNPIDNFEVYQQLNNVNEIAVDNLIYKKVEGVVTVNLLPA